MSAALHPSAVADLLGPWADADRSRIYAVARLHARDAGAAVRLNPLGPGHATVSPPFLDRPVPWALRRAYFVQPEARPGGHPLYGTGAYYAQDASSLLPVSLLDPRPGETICDLCAAPGGKATAILEALGDRGFLLANEAVRSRLGPLRLNLARQGAWRYAVTNLDPDRLARLLGPAFDAVLVDAPCSGQSMVARGKQTAAAFDAKTVKLNARRQRRILGAAAGLLRPGGRLVYATCTYSWAENEQQIIDLLAAVPRAWHPDPAAHLEAFAAGGPAPPACYRLWPDRHRCAGAFAARLHYTPAQPTSTSDSPPSPKRSQSPAPRPADLPFELWGRWNQAPDLVGDPRTCGTLAQDAPAWARSLGSPPQVAFKKGRTWFPAYALAMRRDGTFRPHLQRPLSDDQAAAYLAGRPGAADRDGWCVCTFQGLALGWGKATAGTLKNHLPPAARLAIDQTTPNPAASPLAGKAR